MNPRKLFRGAALAAAASVVLSGVVVLAACGDDDSTATPTKAPATTAASASGTSDTVKVGSLEISNIVVRTTVNDTTAVYFTVKNSGGADKLVSVKADPALVGMTQLHEMVSSGSTSKMQELASGLAIPANGTVSLSPGGYHVMLMDVKKPISAGDTVRVDVVFEKAGSVSFNAKARDDIGTAASPAASATMGH